MQVFFDFNGNGYGRKKQKKAKKKTSMTSNCTDQFFNSEMIGI